MLLGGGWVLFFCCARPPKNTQTEAEQALEEDEVVRNSRALCEPMMNVVMDGDDGAPEKEELRCPACHAVVQSKYDQHCTNSVRACVPATCVDDTSKATSHTHTRALVQTIQRTRARALLGTHVRRQCLVHVLAYSQLTRSPTVVDSASAFVVVLLLAEAHQQTNCAQYYSTPSCSVRDTRAWVIVLSCMQLCGKEYKTFSKWTRERGEVIIPNPRYQAHAQTTTSSRGASGIVVADGE